MERRLTNRISSTHSTVNPVNRVFHGVEMYADFSPDSLKPFMLYSLDATYNEITRSSLTVQFKYFPSLFIFLNDNTR